MSSDLLCVDDGATPQDVFDRLLSARFTDAPVVHGARLVGVMTRKGALRSTLYPPALEYSGKVLSSRL